VFYGANDGSFHAINGNKTGNIGSVPPGGELWSFIPTEFFPKLKRLYSNLPLLKLPTTPTGILPTPKPKDYFFDGITGIYHSVSGSTTTAYIYLSARRGGRLLYALDVSDPSTPNSCGREVVPTSPTTSAATRLAELGQPCVPEGGVREGLAEPGIDFRCGLRCQRRQRVAGHARHGHPAMGVDLHSRRGHRLHRLASGARATPRFAAAVQRRCNPE
jgi:hypothetical protein